MTVARREVVRFALAKLEAGEVCRRAAGLLQDMTGGDFEADAAAAIADALEAVCPDFDPALIEELSGDSAAQAFVRARLLNAWKHASEAEAQLDRCIDALARPDATTLALRARWRAKRGELTGAARDLRLALHLFPDHAFHLRTEKLVEKLSASVAPRRRCRLALLGSSTTALLAPVLRSVLFRDGIAAELYEGPYGAFRQEILDPASGLYRFAPDHVLLLVNRRDLALGPDGGVRGARESAAELRALWRSLQSRLPCHVVQTTYDLPPPGGWGFLESARPEGRRRAVMAANEELATDLPAGVSLLDVEALPLPDGITFRDERGWHASKQYPSAGALPVLAEALASQVRAAMGLASKVLVLDLDNTLWGGIVGEDGVGGIRIGPPTAEGEAYRDLQEYVRDLRSRGVVLAVCSKNNPAEAKAPFEAHDGMLLRLNDFAAFVADWQDKAAGLARIAAQLSLGLDSFVFLDDNPFERTLVRERLPEVVVPEVRADPWSMLAALRRGMYFEANQITSEDLQRNLSYQATEALRSASQSSESLEDFLTGLGMTCEHGPVGPTTLGRVAQLVNKTNQFNLTTRRYTEEQLRRVSGDPGWWCHWFRLSDRFGDHGIVGVILARAEARRLVIDSWLMSCRVLGRRMEDFMCACLVAAAVERGAIEIHGEYLPTAKNGMVEDLYPRMGFAALERVGTFRLELSESTAPRSLWIRGVLREEKAEGR